MAVIQDDPLGALNLNALSEELHKSKNTNSEAPNLYEGGDRHLHRDNHLFSDKPILFRGQRSATFDESVPLNSNLQRSETMPGSSVTSSLVNLGSTLKFNFG